MLEKKKIGHIINGDFVGFYQLEIGPELKKAMYFYYLTYLK